jgi:hypothetical protein
VRVRVPDGIEGVTAHDRGSVFLMGLIARDASVSSLVPRRSTKGVSEDESESEKQKHTPL